MSDVVLGTILGGRYKVTRAVVETAQGDRIFDGEDKTLHRNISIVLSTDKTAGVIAESARQIALGNVNSDLQIIDLGLQGEKAYVVTNSSLVHQLQTILLKDSSNVLEHTAEKKNTAAVSGDEDDFDSLLAPAPQTKTEAKPSSGSRRKNILPELKNYGAKAVNVAPIPATPAVKAPVSKAPLAKKADSKKTGEKGFFSSLTTSLKKLGATNDNAATPTKAPVAAGEVKPQETAKKNSVAAEKPNTKPDIATPQTDAPQKKITVETHSPKVKAQPIPAEPKAPAAVKVQKTEIKDSVKKNFGDLTSSLFGNKEKAATPQTGAKQGVEKPELKVESATQKPKTQAATTAVEAQPILPAKKDLKKIPASKIAGTKKKKTTPAQVVKNIRHIQKQDFKADPITSDAPSIKPIKIATVSGEHIFENSQYYEEEIVDKPQSYIFKVMAGVVAGATILGLGGSYIIYKENIVNGPLSPAAPVGNTPEIAGVNHVPDAKNPSFETNDDGDLKNIYDENTDTYWNTQAYQAANFDGAASNLPIVINLKRKVPVGNVTIQKADGQGGHVEIYASDSGNLDDKAQKVGEADLNGTSVSINLNPAPTTQHIILNFTQLPQKDNGYQLSISSVAIRGK